MILPLHPNPINMKKKSFNPYYVAAIFFAAIFLLTGTVFAQAADTAVPLDFNPLDYVPAQYKPWIWFALGVYELATRIFPTVKNWSISGFIIRIYQKYVPNRNASTPSKPHP